MKIISTTKTPEQNSSSFYICKDNDASTVLFSSMAGYRFVSIYDRDREWQSPMIFTTFQEALLKLKELHDENKKVTFEHKLQIVQITNTSYIQHEYYETFRTDGEQRNANIYQLVVPFEKFYAGHVTGYTERQLIQMRINTPSIGYSNSDIDAAFKRYIEMVDSLPKV
jgi:hypothetical protein